MTYRSRIPLAVTERTEKKSQPQSVSPCRLRKSARESDVR
jgi:hypothetical protein